MSDSRSTKRRRRRWEASQDEDDPLAGLVNLFDLWMVFSIALLIVFVGATKHPKLTANAAESAAEKKAPLDASKAKAIDHYRLSRDTLSGQGEKLGTAYRLPSGEIVCVPDPAPAAKP